MTLPKTRYAFALRGFDPKRILQRNWFLKDKIYKKTPTGGNWQFDLPEGNDEYVLERLKNDIFANLDADNYLRAKDQNDRLILRKKAVQRYYFRVGRHFKWLNDFSKRLREIFYADKEIPLEHIRSLMKRTNELLVEYKIIGKALGKLIKNFEECISAVEYESEGQYRIIFSTRLREARKAAKLTQAQLAERVGMTQGGFSPYETASGEPPLATLIRLSKVLKRSTDWLLGLTP